MPAFDPNSPPVRPGWYSIVRATAAEVAKAGIGAVVCIPISHDWGVEGVATKLTSLSEFDTKFGPTKDDARFAVRGAFEADGVENGGASAVWVYRLPLSGAAKASITLNNTTPAAAITLTAEHKGTFGNGLRVSVRAHPTDATMDQLLVYNGTSLLETWSYVKTDITSLGTMLNDPKTGSDYVAASAITSGVALGVVTSQALTGGLDGTSASADWTTALTNVEGVPFNIITMPNMTDTTVLAAARTWLDNLNRNTRRAMLVTGGSSSDTVSAAVTRSALSSTLPEVVNAGVNVFVDISDETIEKSTAQMTGYFAGLIAGAGVRKSITFNYIPGYKLKARPSNDNVIAAIKGGVLIATQDDAGVRIEKQVTTYTNTADAIRPYAVYSKILSVRILHRIDTDLEALTNAYWVGQTKNNQQTRDAYLGALTDYFRILEDEQVVQPGESSVNFDESEDNTGDTWYPVYRVTLQQAVERVLAVGVIS